MTTHNLAPLKDRLTPAQQEKRRARIHRRGMGRIDMERNLGAVANGTIQAFQSVDQQLVKQATQLRTMRRIVYALLGGAGTFGAVKVATVLGWI